MIKNRMIRTQPDYIFLIVRKPDGWTPTSVDDVPMDQEIVSHQYVASYAEAYDDLLRCNRLSLKRNLDQWAVIQAPGGTL